MGHLKNTRTINVPTYNVSMEDDILNLDTSIGITLVFPNIRDSGCMYADKRWYVNDANGTASANPVTIISVSGIQINDGASQQLSTDNFGTSIFATNENKYIITGTGSGSGGSTIVTSPFTPVNTSIVVGDDFQGVAEKSQGQINDIVTNVTTLQNNEYKITYFAEINAATGTITKPTGSTILLDQFAGGVDAYVSTITNGQPTGDFPETAGGVLVDVTSFDTSGNFVLSGTPSAYPCALIYTLKISAANYQNLDLDNVLELESINQVNALNKGSFGIQILKGQNVISTGLQEAVLTIPYNGTITGWQIYECSTTPVSSSIVIDTWSDAYGNYPPTVLDTIWGGSKPTLTTATKAQVTGLSIPVIAGNTFIFNVDSATSARNIVLIIYVTKS